MQIFNNHNILAYGSNKFAKSCLEYVNNPNNLNRDGHYKIQVESE